MNNFRKRHYFVITLVTSILAAMLVGCGAKADSGGTEVATEAKAESDAINLVETDVGEVEEPVGTPEEDLPALAYKTSEERQNQGKPGAEDLEKLGLTSNKFMMVEEVCDAEELFKDPEFVWPEEVNQHNNTLYMKVKGTLYELYFYDEPEYDLVYFPGDELPEGYEVKETENYEVVICDTHFFGEGHSVMVNPGVYITTDSDTDTLSYKRIPGAFKVRDDIEFDENYDPKDDPNLPGCEIVIKSGMYISLTEPGTHYSEYTIYQILTKEDLEALPEGVTLADDVVHY